MAQTLQNTYYIGPYIMYSYIKTSIPPSKLLKIYSKNWRVKN